MSCFLLGVEEAACSLPLAYLCWQSLRPMRRGSLPTVCFCSRPSTGLSEVRSLNGPCK